MLSQGYCYDLKYNSESVLIGGFFGLWDFSVGVFFLFFWLGFFFFFFCEGHSELQNYLFLD